MNDWQRMLDRKPITKRPLLLALIKNRIINEGSTYHMQLPSPVVEALLKHVLRDVAPIEWEQANAIIVNREWRRALFWRRAFRRLDRSKARVR